MDRKGCLNGIKRLRLRYGMTQKDFSKFTGIPLRTIQNWECGYRDYPGYIYELILFKLVYSDLKPSHEEID